MKGTIGKRKWKAIYRLLDRVSPLKYDCGTLCGGGICCTCDADTIEGEEELGIYLYPGEHLVHRKEDSWLKWMTERGEDYMFPESWTGPVHFVICQTPPVCPREKRPLQCRTFPLKPYLDKERCLHLIWNFDQLPYQCPMIEQNMEIEEDFYKATYTVWSHLIRDPLIYDLVEMDSKERDWRNEQFEEI